MVAMIPKVRLLTDDLRHLSRATRVPLILPPKGGSYRPGLGLWSFRLKAEATGPAWNSGPSA
jgi:hypothetical protein